MELIRMKNILAFIFLGFAISACHTNISRPANVSGSGYPQNMENPSNPLVLTFNDKTYTSSDTISLSIINNSNADINISLRCGRYLEMSYQQKDNGQWSENRELWYMMLKCMTQMHTLKSGDKYDFSLPADKFGSTGSFRLLVPFSVSSDNSSQTLTSIPFQIKSP